MNQPPAFWHDNHLYVLEDDKYVSKSPKFCVPASHLGVDKMIADWEKDSGCTVDDWVAENLEKQRV